MFLNNYSRVIFNVGRRSYSLTQMRQKVITSNLVQTSRFAQFGTYSEDVNRLIFFKKLKNRLINQLVLFLIKSLFMEDINNIAYGTLVNQQGS